MEFVYNTNNELIEEKINGYRVRYDRSQESGQILKQHLDNVNVNYAYSHYGQLDKLQINQHAELLLHYDHQDRDKLWQMQSGFVFAQNYTAN